MQQYLSVLECTLVKIFILVHVEKKMHKHEYSMNKLELYELKSVLKETWMSFCRPHTQMIVAWTLCLKNTFISSINV